MWNGGINMGKGHVGGFATSLTQYSADETGGRVGKRRVIES